MDFTQLFMLLLGLAVGLAAGVVIGIIIQRNRDTASRVSTPDEHDEIHYGAVDPDHIHTMRTEEDSESLEDKPCPVCGKSNPADNLFCTKCGGRLY